MSGYRFWVIGYRYSVLGYRLSVLGYRYSVLGTRYSGETARNAVSTSGQNKAFFLHDQVDQVDQLKKGNLVKSVKLVMPKK